MRIAICYPPFRSEKGVALLTQNRQFQWFSRPTYIFPVVPAMAATMLKRAGHEVLFLDGIAAELTAGRIQARPRRLRDEDARCQTTLGVDRKAGSQGEGRRPRC